MISWEDSRIWNSDSCDTYRGIYTQTKLKECSRKITKQTLHHNYSKHNLPLTPDIVSEVSSCQGMNVQDIKSSQNTGELI